MPNGIEDDVDTVTEVRLPLIGPTRIELARTPLSIGPADDV